MRRCVEPRFAPNTSTHALTASWGAPMAFYVQRGEVPRKRHTIFRQRSGELYREHLMGTLGFSGPASLLYHVHPPTRVTGTRLIGRVELQSEEDPRLRMRHFRLSDLPVGESLIVGRTPLLFNTDLTISLASAKTDSEQAEFYRNAQADEIVYVSEGSGTLESEFGVLPFQAGDYLVIPRGILHRYQPASEHEHLRLLVVESAGPVTPPRRYCNERGQFLEHSPYCERDIRVPQFVPPRDEKGTFELIVKQNNVLTAIELDHHPWDVVGWDGYYYPWALSIYDFEPITGRLHQPPPVHQTFQGHGFVLCSFVPRLFDYHPEAIPAPYNHSNVMSDEVLYYANEEFMSRKGIGYGSLTLHPAGLPHGPHPGKAEDSIGKQETRELAVMVDTFRPLTVAAAATSVEDADYERSWLG